MNCKHYRWENVPREELGPLLARQMISGEKATVARIYLRKGAVVPAHRHEGEQFSYLLEGEMRFQVEPAAPEDRKEVIVKAGEVLCIASNVMHSAEALQDTISLDIFSPRREDWLRGDDQYLRR